MDIKEWKPEIHGGTFRNLLKQGFNLVKGVHFLYPLLITCSSISKGSAVALYDIWVTCHLNENKHKWQLPVLLHFHFSRESIARAGAKNAKALAWNKGNLVESERRDANATPCHGTVSRYQLHLGAYSSSKPSCIRWLPQMWNMRISY